MSAESIRVMCPLFRAEEGGSIPTSALCLRVGEIGLAEAKALNALWHSRLPRVTSPQCRAAYVAAFGGIAYAVAVWCRPIARNLPQYEWLELQRLAISPDAPRNTASRMLAVMARLIRKRFPEISRLVSYQDVAVHTGCIYRAAGWLPTLLSVGGEWARPSRPERKVQSAAPKQRWEKLLVPSPEGEPPVTPTALAIASVQHIMDAPDAAEQIARAIQQERQLIEAAHRRIALWQHLHAGLPQKNGKPPPAPEPKAEAPSPREHAEEVVAPLLDNLKKRLDEVPPPAPRPDLDSLQRPGAPPPKGFGPLFGGGAAPTPLAEVGMPVVALDALAFHGVTTAGQLCALIEQAEAVDATAALQQAAGLDEGAALATVKALAPWLAKQGRPMPEPRRPEAAPKAKRGKAGKGVEG